MFISTVDNSNKVTKTVMMYGDSVLGQVVAFVYMPVYTIRHEPKV